MKRDNPKKKKQKFNGLWVLLIVVVVILIIAIITYVNAGRTSSTQPKQYYSSPTSLTLEKKQEICREVAIWADFCYEQNIDTESCAEQMNEKVMRLWDISASQMVEVYAYCKMTI